MRLCRGGQGQPGGGRVAVGVLHGGAGGGAGEPRQCHGNHRATPPTTQATPPNHSWIFILGRVETFNCVVILWPSLSSCPGRHASSWFHDEIFPADKVCIRSVLTGSGVRDVCEAWRNIPLRGVLALDQPALCGHGNLGITLLRRLFRVRHTTRKRFALDTFCCGLLWLAVDTLLPGL
eukprot:COSAG04_NODE_5945_length_1449_cov_1.687407_2_plen_178_part_00